MSDSLSELLETDAVLDLVASRADLTFDDAMLAGLSCLACAVDALPMPALVEDRVRPPRQSRTCGWALSASIALILASSGFAAAVADDPLAPVQYVKERMMTLTPPPEARGWDLDGTAVVRARRDSGAEDVTPAPAATGSAVPHGTAASPDTAPPPSPTAPAAAAAGRPTLGFGRVRTDGPRPASRPVLGFGRVRTEAAHRGSRPAHSASGTQERGDRKRSAVRTPPPVGSGGQRGPGKTDPTPRDPRSPTSPDAPSGSEHPQLPLSPVPPPPPPSDGGDEDTFVLGYLPVGKVNGSVPTPHPPILPGSDDETSSAGTAP